MKNVEGPVVVVPILFMVMKCADVVMLQGAGPPSRLIRITVIFQRLLAHWWVSSTSCLPVGGSCINNPCLHNRAFCFNLVHGMCPPYVEGLYPGCHPAQCRWQPQTLSCRYQLPCLIGPIQLTLREIPVAPDEMRTEEHSHERRGSLTIFHPTKN